MHATCSVAASNHQTARFVSSTSSYQIWRPAAAAQKWRPLPFRSVKDFNSDRHRYSPSAVVLLVFADTCEGNKSALGACQAGHRSRRSILVHKQHRFALARHLEACTFNRQSEHSTTWPVPLQPAAGRQRRLPSRRAAAHVMRSNWLGRCSRATSGLDGESWFARAS